MHISPATEPLEGLINVYEIETGSSDILVQAKHKKKQIPVSGTMLKYRPGGRA
ncbi:hypothetical protein DL89DRAFT_270557 [Linderina pennispora]|uniref:Uncharacterized protein n=1 Tax=Linderina pennispora TaxID=61395 RepID=A0A1Y1VX30_9FUNG|nr:uncharacterized protein DL89DRAFT_270557 [Linderina pennispora]ORX65830.1 hypothetical protein DL89DRAFT_270557 [Linderina pennispora]